MKLWSTKSKRTTESTPEATKRGFGQKGIIIISAAAALIAAMSVALAIYTFSYDKAFINVKIGDEYVTGKTRDEIIALIAENGASEFDDVGFDITVGENTTHVTATELKATRDWNKAADQAFEIGRTGSLPGRMLKVFTCFFTKHDVYPDPVIDETALNDLITKIAEENNVAAVDAAYNANTDTGVLVLTPAKDGIKINEDELRTRILNNFDTATYENIVLTTETAPAKQLDMDEVYAAVHTEVKDATMSVEGDKHMVSPHVLGVDFDLDFAKEQLAASPDKNVEIPLAIKRPKVTTTMLESTLFNDTLSSVTTYYSPKKVSRTHNVALAAKFINGTVLNPGEVFSYNKTVGPRTAARGFKKAAIFAQGEVVDGLGGGICQVSSTLYMATMSADLETVSRKNHSFYVDYAPKGQDATVVYGSIDFQFKNNTSYPIKIVAVQKNNYITVTIKGTKTETKTVKITSKTHSTTPFSEKIVEDKSLKPGERVIEQKGQPGMTMDVYRNVYDANGKLIRSEHENKTRYVPMTQIVRVGPASSATAAPAPDASAPTVSQTPETTTPEATTPETTPEATTPETTPEATTPETETEAVAPEVTTPPTENSTEVQNPSQDTPAVETAPTAPETPSTEASGESAESTPAE